MNRRKFLHYSAHVAGGTVAGFAALHNLYACRPQDASDAPIAGLGEGGYGALMEAGPQLALPQGFHYRRIGVAGSVMSDGFPTPAAHDGMAAFPLPNGNIRLIRNHELSRRADNAPQLQPTYDAMAGGGTTSLEIDPTTRRVVRDYVSLSGTVRNCAGGPTPWGSWLSCEESVVGTAAGAERQHGYIFDVPVGAEAPVTPVPLKAMGRFVHEAVAVDPATGIVYETEDQRRGGFYRFLPAQPYTSSEAGDLAAGGQLQMLAIRDRPNQDCDSGQVVGQSMQVAWVDIADPDPADAEANAAVVFEQGWDQGAARFSRVEGCWYGEGSVYFSCTNGGDASVGQIWRYRPLGGDRGELTLVFESPSSKILNRPDNVAVSPRGGIVLCEDGGGQQFIRGLTREGRIFDFAKNIANDSELAGATFSPDGATMFVNVQRDPGATFAIWGPWERGAL